MIYIVIPKDRQFQPGGVSEDGVVTEDRFICTQGLRPDISIQQAVHVFYHQSFFHSKGAHGEVDGLTLFKKRPLIAEPLLEYRAKNNGRQAAEYVKDLSLPKSIIAKKPMEYVGRRWIDHTLLSPERREIALQKEEEQRLNRQKIGPSPSTN